MLLFVLLIIFPLILLFLLPRLRKNEPFSPPPGPEGSPLIGNLNQIDFTEPHVSLFKLAKIYGPIVTLRFGFQRVVVVQSAKLAKEVLKTQDLNFCSRPYRVGLRKLSYDGLDMAFTPYGDYFREIKKLCIVHLLSPRKVQSFAQVRQEETSRLIKKISSLSSASKIINFSELAMNYSCSNMCRVAFGKRYDDDEGSRSKFHSLLNEAQAMFTSFYFSDYFPYMGWLDMLTGQSSKLDEIYKRLDAFYENIINDHLDKNKPESEQKDFIDILLRLQKENSFGFELTMNHFKAVLMNVFVAGTDTSAIMLVWAMTELIKNPMAMKKVQEELRKGTNKGYTTDDDLSKFEYFMAVVKETLRMHPAAPILIARDTLEKTTLGGYDILPKTLLYVNVYSIGRDPESWKDPDMFIPERFIGSPIDFKGHDFEFIPFGAGRRICPGLHLGAANMTLTLANLLYSFDWEIPAGTKTEDIDDKAMPGLAMHKKNPLHLVAKKFG